MSKAKIASKNNPDGRKQSKKYFYNKREIRPVKLITTKQSFLSAEYEDSGELVLDSQGESVSWSNAKNLEQYSNF